MKKSIAFLYLGVSRRKCCIVESGRVRRGAKGGGRLKPSSRSDVHSVEEKMPAEKTVMTALIWAYLERRVEKYTSLECVVLSIDLSRENTVVSRS